MKANARSIYSAIETLESRIAPATVTFPLTDANGDHVRFTASGPLVTTSNFVSTLVTVIPLLDVGKHDAFVVNLAGSEFAGANLTVSVTKVPGGDGQTYIGVTAGANNLGTVNIHGDLGLLVAGAGGTSDIAIKSLTVNSIGRFPSVPPDVLVTSTISGSITKLAVKGNMSGTYFRVTENIGTVSIGGSVIGGDIADDGALIADGTITKVTIGGSVRGGSGAETGLVAAHGDMGTLIIRGSIYGGDGGSSGDVGSNANLTSAKVTGSIYGGNGLESGEIFGAYTTDGTIGTVTVGGSLVGGTGNDSGQIGNGGATATTVSITDVTVGGDLVGGNGELSGSVAATGGSITTLVVKGSLFGGEGQLSGVVGASLESGSFTVDGSMYGGFGIDSGSIVCVKGLATMSLKGSLIGGDNNGAGSLLFNSGMVSHEFKVGGDVVGSIGNNSGDITDTGGVPVIGGEVFKGSGTNSGTVTT